MRSIKTFAAAAFLAISVTSAASAQAGRPFRDSWFWGLRTGAMTYSGYGTNANTALAGSVSVAPLIGLDWLITRTHGGLYVAYSQALLSTQGVVPNGPTAADSGVRRVNVGGMRRGEIMGVAFPGDFLKWHPYVGFGVSFRYLSDAEAVGPFPSTKQADFAASTVNDVKAGIGPAFIAGTQYRMKRLSVFGQILAATTERTFLLSNGHPTTLSTEFGVRYNFGTSIER